ncbi:methylated-DNA--[protein]-cysteine S-methyltransferase [Bdellovibrio sp. BCCA]|uniref:methylated-DNA--[protein]-cysteine S-methyltransferase n=1 Tax=Bdellovibrio sp. BCCA TaxID=3136281 RepID=UPI0030F03FCC
MSFYYQIIESPIGDLHAIADDESLWILGHDTNIKALKAKFPEVVKKENEIIADVRKQLKEYFSGKRQDFDVPVTLKGTEFQCQTWKALSKIPYGKTVSYQEQATKLRKPLAVRAVGRTNGLNPISIILPCHRVIAKSGHLTGYAGGLKAKEFLLDLEKRHSD